MTYYFYDVDSVALPQTASNAIRVTHTKLTSSTCTGPSYRMTDKQINLKLPGCPVARRQNQGRAEPCEPVGGDPRAAQGVGPWNRSDAKF